MGRLTQNGRNPSHAPNSRRPPSAGADRSPKSRSALRSCAYPPSNQVASRHRTASSRTTSSIVLYTTGHHSQRSAIFVCRPTYQLYGVVSNTQKLNTCKYSKGYTYVRHSPLNPCIMQLQIKPAGSTKTHVNSAQKSWLGFKRFQARWSSMAGSPHKYHISLHVLVSAYIPLISHCISHIPPVSPISRLYPLYPAISEGGYCERNRPH